MSLATFLQIKACAEPVRTGETGATPQDAGAGTAPCVRRTPTGNKNPQRRETGWGQRMQDIIGPYGANYGKVLLEGLHNTRDLGGLPTGEGHVTPRRLLRSGMLEPATAEDMRVLRDVYDVRLVVDLRTDEEAARWPDPIELLPGARLVHLPVFRAPKTDDAQETIRALGERLASGELDIAELFAGLYPRFVLEEDGIAAYRGLFRELLDLEDGAALWHCSAGKDRCGMASVLVEAALGVPWELIEQDYLATNELIEAKGTAQNMFDVGGVDARYLHAALSAIDGAYGSIDGYLADALGIDEAARSELRRKFVSA